MTLVYLGLYVLILAAVWGFFIVARIHAYKFKNMSSHIPIVTNALFFTLLILSIIGLVMVFFLDEVNTRDVYVEEYKEDTIRLDTEIF